LNSKNSLKKLNQGCRDKKMNTKKRQRSASQTPTSQFQQPVTNNQQRASNIPDKSGFPLRSNKYPASIPRPFIIPIFIPHAGCPHQCIFCNQVSITGAKQKMATPAELRVQIGEFLRYKKENRKPVQIAFFGGNFLGLKSEEIKSLLELAADFVRDGQVDGIRCSTRPDTIHERSLDLIKDYPISAVELGVQSMDDQVLALAGRGHTAAETVRAVERLKERHFSIGLQMMVGLPGDDETGALTTAQRITDLGPDFVRIYPTLVVANSRLAGWYQSSDYAPMSLEEGVTLVKKIYLKFKKAGIEVIRMGLQASKDLEDETTVLAGPYHPAFGHLVHSEIFLDMALSAIESATCLRETLTIFVHPRSISKMRGLKNANIKRLKEQFHFHSIVIVPDSSLAAEELMVK
jgi:histone acetyltransferase (RNA polymerase elongator complex component)